ncbi:hypothetical protein [Cellulosimicrobium funkei]|uniref:hypothetical protein n=1 Tax=Cellulosimicrobium funkei TaxID=264251 RepID=UPI00341ED96D
MVAVVIVLAVFGWSNRGADETPREPDPTAECEAWNDELYSASSDAEREARTIEAVAAATAAYQAQLAARPEGCADAWTAAVAPDHLCEAWAEMMYQTYQDGGWPLTVPPDQVEATASAVQASLAAALAAKPLPECDDTDWKVETATESAWVKAEEPPPVYTDDGAGSSTSGGGGAGGGAGVGGDVDSPVNVGCGWSWRGGFGCGVGVG